MGNLLEMASFRKAMLVISSLRKDAADRGGGSVHVLLRVYSLNP